MRETQSTLHKTLENLEKALAEVRQQPCLWCYSNHTSLVEYLYQLVVQMVDVVVTGQI